MPQNHRKPAVFQKFTNLIAAESTRHGGVSLPPYDSQNLGGSTDDDPEAVAQNRILFYDSLGIDPASVASSHQVHGNEIWLTDAPGRTHGYDAVVTATPGVVALVTIADCTPVLIYDTRQHVVAAIHAGWRGTVAGIVTKTLGLMHQNFDTRGEDCVAYVGTCISQNAFEVGEEVAQHFSETFKRFDAKTNKFFVDLKAANTAQLLACGVNDIEISGFCTVKNNEDYFSHRYEKGTTGRMVAVIGMV